MPPQLELSDDDLFDLCSTNKEMVIERNADKQLIIMAPTGGFTSSQNIEISAEIALWNRKTNFGKAFDSNGGFLLPNGAMRAADAAWITKEKWNSLTHEQKEKFLPLCPDFVIELRSKSDSLKYLMEKMEEWRDNGCSLGWLIDPYEHKSYIYKSGFELEIIEGLHHKLSGEDVLPGFELDLTLLKS